MSYEEFHPNMSQMLMERDDVLEDLITNLHKAQKWYEKEKGRGGKSLQVGEMVYLEFQT